MADYDNINMLSDYTLCTLRTQTTNSILLCSPQAPHSIRLDWSTALLAAEFFSEMPNIDVLNLFPPDVMHDFMEGVVPVVICVALNDVIAKSNLDILSLNSLLANFTYGQCDVRNRYGAEVTTNHLRNQSIPGTASEKLCLPRLLPIILVSFLSEQIMKIIEGIRLSKAAIVVVLNQDLYCTI